MPVRLLKQSRVCAMEDKYHTPLFTGEIIALLQDHACRLVVDATCGEGGHTLAMLKAGIQVIPFDYDPHLVKRATERLRKEGYENVTVYNTNFANMQRALRAINVESVDAVLFDVGISLYHIKQRGMGFGLEDSEPLDLRASGEASTTGSQLINSLPRRELYELIAYGSEITSSRRLADLIVQRRAEQEIKTVGDLRMIIRLLTSTRKEETATLTRLLQALRIRVNDELNALKQGLREAAAVVRPGGLISTITFHSLEDRLVKLYFKKRPEFVSVVDKPKRNITLPFAESALLRAYAYAHEKR